MKRIILAFLLTLFLPVMVYSQMQNIDRRYDYVQEADSSDQTYWQIVGTETDYSEWYQIEPFMTLRYFSCDTTTGANGDSVDIDLTIQTAQKLQNGSVDTDLIKDWKTITITADSSMAEFNLTASTAIGLGVFRYKLTGSTDNDKDAGSLIKMQHISYTKP